MRNEEAANKWFNSDTDLFLNSLQNNLSEFKVNVLNHPTLLIELDDHVEIMGSHRILMIKKIVGCYVAMRVKHFCRQFNMQSLKFRVQLSKRCEYITVRYKTVRYKTVRYRTVRYKTVRYKTVRYKTSVVTKRYTFQNGTLQNGTVTKR